MAIYVLTKDCDNSILVQLYTRAAASDYDDWEKVYGNKGWGSDHLIPLLKKVRLSPFIRFPTLELTTTTLGRNLSTRVDE